MQQLAVWRTGFWIGKNKSLFYACFMCKAVMTSKESGAWPLKILPKWRRFFFIDLRTAPGPYVNYCHLVADGYYLRKLPQLPAVKSAIFVDVFVFHLQTLELRVEVRQSTSRPVMALTACYCTSQAAHGLAMPSLTWVIICTVLYRCTGVCGGSSNKYTRKLLWFIILADLIY